jgi:hypothetical protein
MDSSNLSSPSGREENPTTRVTHAVWGSVGWVGHPLRFLAPEAIETSGANTVPTMPHADFILAKSCGYTLTPSSATLSPLSPFGSFSVTRTTANDCAWTVSTPDAWFAVLDPTSGAGSGTISYSAVGSGVTRVVISRRCSVQPSHVDFELIYNVLVALTHAALTLSGVPVQACAMA